MTAVNNADEKSPPANTYCTRAIGLGSYLSLTVKAFGDSFSLSWNSVSSTGITAQVKYDIYRRIGNADSWGEPMDTTTNTSYSDNISCPGYLTEVRYRIKAYIDTPCGRVDGSDAENYNVCY